MYILVACEESQAVTLAFRDLGIKAFSSDVQPCSGGHREFHILGDCLEILNAPVKFKTMDGKEHFVDHWDAIIAFPPCTDLAVSGARWFAQKRADGRQQRSIEFFKQFTRLDCPHVAIENPIGIMSTEYRKPDQIIQPFQFGHAVRKSTCLWLKGLPKLIPTEYVNHKEDEYGFTYGGSLRYARDDDGKILAWNNPETAKIRSKTYTGIARAMATQWSDYLRKEKQ